MWVNQKNYIPAKLLVSRIRQMCSLWGFPLFTRARCCRTERERVWLARLLKLYQQVEYNEQIEVRKQKRISKSLAWGNTVRKISNVRDPKFLQ